MVISKSSGSKAAAGDAMSSVSTKNVVPRGSFAETLAQLGKSLDTSEREVHRVTEGAGLGRDYSPAELLSLQTGVYRFSELVDLSSRFVDRAASAVKTVLSGQ